MMYVTYDKDTGRIVSFGYMDKIHIENQIAEGHPIILVDREIAKESWQVNLKTKTLEPKE